MRQRLVGERAGRRFVDDGGDGGMFAGGGMAEVGVDAHLGEEFGVAVAFLGQRGRCAVEECIMARRHAGVGGGVNGGVALHEGVFPDDRADEGAGDGEDVVGFVEPEDLQDESRQGAAR